MAGKAGWKAEAFRLLPILPILPVPPEVLVPEDGFEPSTPRL